MKTEFYKAIDYHPNDSRCRYSNDNDICQTLSTRMGTGGGNVPLVMMEIEDECRADTLRPIRILQQLYEVV